MRIFILFFILSTLVSRFAGAAPNPPNPTDPFTPEYKKLPFLALAGPDFDLPPEQVVGLVVARAARICDFLKQPEGRYRQRGALNIQTGVYASDTAVAHLEMQRNGTLKLKLLKFDPKGRRPEIFNSLRCKGR